MLTWFRRILAPPIFEGDEDKTRTARLLNVILWATLLIALAGSPTLLLSGSPLPSAAAIGAIAIVVVSALLLMRSGRVRLAASLFAFVLWGFDTVLILFSGGTNSLAAASYILAVIIAGLLLSGRAAVAIAGLSIAAGFGIYLAELNGLLPPAFVLADPISGWVLLTVFTIVASALLYLATGSIDEALSSARRYAAELEEQRQSLELAVEERTYDLSRRTRYLEAAALVARDAASVLSLQELLPRVANLISEQLGFYHTGIFLLDPEGTWAVLEAASSEGGQRMLSGGHRLHVGAGIVGYVVEHGEPRIALDVGANAVFFDNPDLPETHSEIALPLRARGEVIGALDVQSMEPGAFSDEDVAALQILTDQVAVAISNARLFEQAQESLEAERRAYGEYSREAWQELLRGQPDLAFLSDARATIPAGDLWRPEMFVALRTGEVAHGQGDTPTVAIPLKVRDQVIGVIDGRKRDGTGEWTPQEIELLQALTEQLNTALEGARLYRDTQQRAARDRMVGQATTRMRETLDVETVLETAMDEISRALGLAALDLRLSTQPGLDGEPVNSTAG